MNIFVIEREKKNDRLLYKMVNWIDFFLSRRLWSEKCDAKMVNTEQIQQHGNFKIYGWDQMWYTNAGVHSNLSIRVNECL